MVRVNHVYRICYQNSIMPNSCQCHIHFPFVPDSLLIEHISESELRFSRNYYVIIPFQIEYTWPDRTSQVSMETVAFAVLCPV